MATEMILTRAAAIRTVIQDGLAGAKSVSCPGPGPSGPARGLAQCREARDSESVPRTVATFKLPGDPGGRTVSVTVTVVGQPRYWPSLRYVTVTVAVTSHVNEGPGCTQ